MSIASAITAAQGKVAAAYTAISNKGGTLPATQNLSNMPTAINSIPTSSSPIIQSLSITPSTSAQTFNASGVDGYKPVSVSAVTSAIDNNITAGNIKSGVSILGVAGSVTELNGSTKTVTPTTSQQTVTPTSPSNGLTSVTVNAVTSSIDANITAGNIKKNVTILGVTGIYEGSGGGYTEFPSYKVTNGVATRRSGALTGNEFSNITEIGTNGMYYAFYKCTGLTGALDLSSVTSIGSYGMSYAFNGCTGLTGALDLSSLTSIGSYGMSYAFYMCYGLISVDLSSVTSIDSSGMYYAFQGCTGLRGALDLSSLTSIGSSGMQYAFGNCSKITSVNLSSLTSIGTNGMYYAFQGCTGLTSVDLSSLSSIGSYGMNYAFYSCTGLEHVYFRALTTTSFGSYKTQFQNMLSGTGTAKTHTLHFPSNLQSTISGLTGYPTFGGTSGYVTLAFDLPATVTLTGADSVTYTRNPKHDTATALAWKVGAYGTKNFEPAYYTSGLTDPTVGTTIYSDAACTTTVTTVSTIA